MTDNTTESEDYTFLLMEVLKATTPKKDSRPSPLLVYGPQGITFGGIRFEKEEDAIEARRKYYQK